MDERKRWGRIHERRAAASARRSVSFGCRSAMPLDIRLYAGFAGQAGRLSAVRHELETLLRSVTGLRRVLLVETSEGLAIVTEGDDRTVCEECARHAERWMRERMPALSDYAPLAVMGEVIAEARGATSDRMVLR